jgi:energy-coupling factor transport system permease protein
MAVLIPHLKLLMLFGLVFVLALALTFFRVRSFVSMMRRMRWLFFSMLVVYAYTTPGEYLSDWPMEFAPSYEGLREGVYQVFRVSLVLAGISILLATSTRENLMVGIYTLIKPLNFLSVSPERFTARLYLTLQYIEHAKKQSVKQDRASDWRDNFYAVLGGTQDIAPSEIISLIEPSLHILDYLCVAAFLMLMGIYL